MTAPDWLTKHGGSLRPGIDGVSWFVYFADKPQYEVTPTPVAGKHGCTIRQTINGRHLENKVVCATAEEAVRGGLEELRKTLGW
jgi:hypothetical protein